MIYAPGQWRVRGPTFAGAAGRRRLPLGPEPVDASAGAARSRGVLVEAAGALDLGSLSPGAYQIAGRLSAPLRPPSLGVPGVAGAVEDDGDLL
jgi:hypothetical protein